MKQTVNIVNITMFPASIVQTVFMHCDLWSIKNWWFVHVIPYVQI
jgi:hypothetical protein